jgi:hypothetical protein
MPGRRNHPGGLQQALGQELVGAEHHRRGGDPVKGMPSSSKPRPDVRTDVHLHQTVFTQVE